MSGFENDVMLAKNINFDEAGSKPHLGIINAAGKFPIGTGSTSPTPEILAGTITSPNGTITIGYSSPNITMDTTGVNDLHTARFIVASSTLGTGANFTTISAAIAAAQGTGINSTIFIQPGTYTENFTLPANINLAAYMCDSTTPNVTIVGNITCSDAGSRSISGINLQTNSAALLTVSGTLATVVYLFGCNLKCTNNTGITFSSSSASSFLLLTDCRGDLTTTGIALFSMSASGSLGFVNGQFGNTGGSTTASTVSAGSVTANATLFSNPITSSGTGALGLGFSIVTAANATALTLGGSGVQNLFYVRATSGTASAISISATATVDNCVISSSNANAITGAGTISYGWITFIGSSSTINTSTQTSLISKAGTLNLKGGIGVGATSTGSGLTFDGTNTLSIFSQGTFNPTIQGATVAGTVSMSTQAGRYQKVGRIVVVSIYCNWTTIGTATGAVQINNLPFSVVNNATTSLCPSFVGVGAFNLALGTNAVAYMQPIANTTTANIAYYIGGAATAPANTTITASNGFTTQLVYETT